MMMVLVLCDVFSGLMLVVFFSLRWCICWFDMVRFIGFNIVESSPHGWWKFVERDSWSYHWWEDWYPRIKIQNSPQNLEKNTPTLAVSYISSMLGILVSETSTLNRPEALLSPSFTEGLMVPQAARLVAERARGFDHVWPQHSEQKMTARWWWLRLPKWSVRGLWPTHHIPQRHEGFHVFLSGYASNYGILFPRESCLLKRLYLLLMISNVPGSEKTFE